MLQIITGILFLPALNFTQSELLAQNDNLNDLDESGAIILKKSIDSISRFVRVECNMRVSTFVGGVEFPASGKYEEQAVAASGTQNIENNDDNNTDNSPKNHLSEFQRTMYRQELNFVTDKLPIRAEPNRVILVCYPNKNDSKNGNIWQFRSINGNKTLQQINIDAVEAAIKKSFGTGEEAGGNVRGQIVVGDSDMFKQVGMLWNVGGIAGVLGQISRFYEFGELPKAETIDNTKTVKLVGSLRKTYFDLLLQDHGGLEAKDRYPSHLPCDIEVYIGADDSFPRKIRYLNRKTESAKPTNLLVEINYTNITINGNPIPEHRFSTFQNEVPIGVSKIDSNTDQYIKSLGLQQP
ncbi:MAG: hypothetical protein LBL39_07690 [Planctomycetaceae bacterium]|nr:hypothetical protein [Planctomycetaceae bacterium]